MNISFISYEYPPDTATGGIATYARQAARMLSLLGHRVEVFAASHTRTGTDDDAGVVVHRVIEPDVGRFAATIAPFWAARHREIRFDVLEAGDYQADAREAIRLVPDMPFVVRLHTPASLVRELCRPPMPRLEIVRQTLGAWRRGKHPFWDARMAPTNAMERDHALAADVIASPSHAIADRLMKLWGLDPKKIAIVPLPYEPSPALLAIDPATTTNIVGYVGRLEIRKGVITLIDAIPRVLAKQPDVRFRLVGKSEPISPQPGVDVKTFLQRRLGDAVDHVDFIDAVPLEQVPAELAKIDIAVFPSIWESYGLVCVEAMAAARGIIASSSGGMAEILDGGEYGDLVPPQRPATLADAIVKLLAHPAARQSRGQAARQRVLSNYALSHIGQLQLTAYRQAIQHRTAVGSRSRRQPL